MYSMNSNSRHCDEKENNNDNCVYKKVSYFMTTTVQVVHQFQSNVALAMNA